MKKSIVAISSILQFIAVVMYYGVIRSMISWRNGDTTFSVVAVASIIAIAAQAISIQLKNKHKDEVEKAESIMQTPKNSYGWIALGIFGIAAAIVIIYVLTTQ